MEPEKVTVSKDNDWSYYLEYNTELDFSTGAVNMFGYCRVSTRLQSQFGSSIETQIKLLVDECKRYQYDESNKRTKFNLMRIYVDDGVSAKNIKGRPSLVDLMKHISSLVTGRSHKKIGVVVSDLSRLTRSSESLQEILNWIKNDSIKLKFIDTSVDPESNSGQMMLNMLTAFFEFERKNSSFKTRLTLRSMSENGTLTGHCSYGWTCGKNEAGKKIDIPVEEEQEGLLKVIELSRANPEATSYQIKNMMNKTDILCLRGPGRNFRGIKPTEKSIKKNEGVEWTGKWTAQIVEKIIEHDRFDDRLKAVKEKNKDNPINIMNKDEIVIQAIKDHLDETDGYDEKNFNISEITRAVDDKMLFQKKLDRNYVKRMMIVARIIKPEIVVKAAQNEDEILSNIKELIDTKKIMTYTSLTDILIENDIPLIGKRKAWNKTNVRDLCIKFKLELYGTAQYKPFKAPEEDYYSDSPIPAKQKGKQEESDSSPDVTPKRKVTTKKKAKVVAESDSDSSVSSSEDEESDEEEYSSNVIPKQKQERKTINIHVKEEESDTDHSVMSRTKRKAKK